MAQFLKFDRKQFFDGFRSRLDSTIEQEQVDGLEFILGRMETSVFWVEIPQIAYALATVFHETAGSFQPVEECYYLGSKARVKAAQKALKYSPWFGRGYVQLTWQSNYQKASDKLGVDFIKTPSAVMEPVNAFNIMTYGMHQGWFTKFKLDDYINGTKKDYVHARKIINGMDKAGLIAGYATSFEKILNSALISNSATVTETENRGELQSLNTDSPTHPTTSIAEPSQATSTVSDNITTDNATTDNNGLAFNKETVIAQIPSIKNLWKILLPTGAGVIVAPIGAKLAEMPDWLVLLIGVLVGMMFIGIVIFASKYVCQVIGTVNQAMRINANPKLNNVQLISREEAE